MHTIQSRLEVSARGFPFRERLWIPDEPPTGWVYVQVLFCGVCGSDVHKVHNDWGSTRYPIVPGHEIIGTLANGDVVGVGCMVDSCGRCGSCTGRREQYCPKTVWTYNSDGPMGTTCGGLSSMVLVNQKFLIRIDLPVHDDRLPQLCPMLCAGVTVWSALRDIDVKDKRVVIKGFGGVGQAAAKITRCLGAHVTVMTSKPWSSCEYVDSFVTTDEGYDILLLTSSHVEELASLLAMLRPAGTAIMLGLPKHNFELSAFDLVDRGLTLVGSSVGSLNDTRDIIDFALKNPSVLPDVTVVDFTKAAVQTVFDTLRSGTGKGRYVVAM